jgi:nitrate reductase beta subunit
VNVRRSERWAMEEACKAEWTGAPLLARDHNRGFEQPIRSGPRRQHPLTADHGEHADRGDHCLFEYPRICGRRQVCSQTGVER